jgi:hypothetical protein
MGIRTRHLAYSSQLRLLSPRFRRRVGSQEEWRLETQVVFCFSIDNPLLANGKLNKERAAFPQQSWFAVQARVVNPQWSCFNRQPPAANALPLECSSGTVFATYSLQDCRAA